MSYDLGLYYDGEPAKVETHSEGGTYVLGGTDEAQLNITYNYSKFYYEVLDRKAGLRWLYGKTGRQTAGRLEHAVELLGTERDADYWKATEGNAGYALSILLAWAKAHPDAVWNGD